MKLFILENCPHCRNARRWIKELQDENPEYNQIEIESHFDDDIYHVNVSPLTIELVERDEVLKSYSLVHKDAKEIAEDIIKYLEKHSK